MYRSMMAHRRRLYGTELAINWDRLPVSQTEYIPQVYKFSFPRDTTKYQ